MVGGIQLNVGFSPSNMVSIQLGSAALICFIVVLKHGQISAKDVDTHQNRTGKFLSLFSLIQFPNDACPGSDGRNGSCFTQGECDQRGGNAGGSCASGFGVCCVFIKMCGQTVNTECSYLVQTRLTPVPSDCSYTICKSNPNICRIRLDFQSFDIAGPTSDMIADATGLTSIGDCLSDSFSFTAPGGLGSPIICGFNTGQHMILDASDSCNVASFNIDPVGTTAREWDIKVTQFDCADEAGGPPGCLQYYSNPTGIVRSFGFRPSVPLTGDETHLSQQCYSMCFRQMAGMCNLCFTVETTTALMPNSFGLSSQVGVTDMMSLTDSECSTDYLLIPRANSPSSPAIADRVCGTAFNTEDLTAPSEKVCTALQPYIVTFKTDEGETDDERMAAPTTGSVGFSLKYVYEQC
ncbi:hypothetical protein TCAL_11518 [Tigriopus californicus]|uniref:CUB domain-containing protein n=1 Tax=Tigriopus californicus TaxID=6832 RepID=A0A553P8P7_TIGCA|nr:uncharacterized protein LOC131877513 [Tigriopus californicus]TRY74061.1 hypothetical protein TCAL_11518 [Tigriopus californicus]